VGAFGDFYTYTQDVMVGIGSGSPVAYRYDVNAFTTDPLGEPGQGEMVAWDATNFRVLRFNRTGANGKFIGVSRDSASGLKRLGNQPGLTLPELSVMTSGVHAMLGTVGETYTHGVPVFQNGTNTTQITSVAAGGVQVGIVQNPKNLSFVGAVRVPILIDNFTQTQK
jgi:hypothetical protein